MAIAAIAGLGLGATALGGAIGAAGGIMGGIASSNMYKYQAGIAQMNAKIAQQTAAYDVGVGEVQSQISGMKTSQKLGQIKATQGASGLSVNSGTGVSVRASEAEVGAMDQQEIRGKAAFAAYGQEVTAAGDIAQANADSMAASNSLIAGGINAASSILGGVGSFSSKWLQLNQQGALPAWATS